MHTHLTVVAVAHLHLPPVASLAVSKLLTILWWGKVLLADYAWIHGDCEEVRDVEQDKLKDIEFSQGLLELHFVAVFRVDESHSNSKEEDHVDADDAGERGVVCIIDKEKGDSSSRVAERSVVLEGVVEVFALIPAALFNRHNSLLHCL